MVNPRVAVVQPVMVPGGGTEAVTAWTIEALKNQCQVCLLTFSPVDHKTLNQYYGTDLAEDDFNVVRPFLFPPLRKTKRFSFLKDHLMMRYCKTAGRSFDLFIGIADRMEFGRKSIQYVGLAPAAALVSMLRRDRVTPSANQWLKRGFTGVCEVISRFSEETMKGNVTLANSNWTGKVLEAVYGVHDYKVVYPPVITPPSSRPWDKKEEGFLCIARIVPEKRLEFVIEALTRVREKGFNVSLHIIGRPDDLRYSGRIRQLSEENPSWVSMHGVLGRQELFAMLDEYKYGINAAADEPFGIGVAEMVKAGNIVFVANGGGQTEIVDDPGLTFGDMDDAVDKIIAVLGSEDSQNRTRTHLERQGDIFSTSAFCRDIQSVVEGYFSAGKAPSDAGEEGQWPAQN